MTQPPAASVQEVVSLYEEWGADPYDEEVSQLDHALQTAALAEADGATDELVVAALLHDVGHLLDLRSRAEADPGAKLAPIDADLEHELTGSAWLSELYPAQVTAPIALHVQAKRYRCGTEPAYLDALSGGSTRSLARQGGPLTREEALVFETEPGFHDAVRLRAWDDCGKVDGLALRPFDDHLERLRRLAT